MALAVFLACSDACSEFASLALSPCTWSCLRFSAACTAVSVDSITAGEAERVRRDTEEGRGGLEQRKNNNS